VQAAQQHVSEPQRQELWTIQRVDELNDWFIHCSFNLKTSILIQKRHLHTGKSKLRNVWGQYIHVTTVRRCFTSVAYLAVRLVHLCLAGLHSFEIIVIVIITLVVGSFVLTQKELEGGHHDARIGVKDGARCNTHDSRVH